MVVSIFVNPAQFGKGEDFKTYPRPVASDNARCRSLGVDMVFRPAATAMYPDGYSTMVEEASLSAGLCGASRPGHFRGVCTVVAKLFHLVEPDIAIFGEKDFQQLAILRRMARDLNFSVRIVGCPTVRERDGLALSSRNQYLTPAERAAAPRLYAALCEAREMFQSGERRAARLKTLIRRRLQAIPEARIDYVELVGEDDLRPVGAIGGRCILAAAACFGHARLIDHITLQE